MNTATRLPDLVNGIITNWIPLTTPGPPSTAICSSAVYFMPSEGTRLVAFDPYYGNWIDPDVKCLATEHSQWWDQHSDFVTTDINLGPFACPTGFTTATASPMNPLTTVIGCCPRDYKYQGTLLEAASLGQCLSPLTVGQVVTAKSTSDGFTWYAVTTTVATAQDMMGVHINGFIFKLAAESSSPASTTASTTASGASSTLISKGPTASSPSSTSAMSTETPSSTSTSKSSAGLGSGAKIGIGIGVSLTVVAILCLIGAYFFLRRRRLAKAKDPTNRGFVEAPDSSLPPGSKVVPFVEAASGTPPTKWGPVEMWVPPNKGG